MVTFTKIQDGVYILKDRAGCCANLVVGDKKALLFDTCTGADDMKKAVSQITDLPLMVIASHGHFDHIGGSIYFDEVYMREEELSIFAEYSDEIITGWIKDMCGLDKSEDYVYDCRGWEQFRNLDFDEFDLGNLKCQMIPLPGHTIGSVGVYIPSLKLLLSGDALTPVMCMNFSNHGTLEDLKSTIKKVKELDMEYYLTSHHEYKMPKAQLDIMMECLEHSPEGRYHEYQYETPPYDMGWFYLYSVEEEPIGLILAYDTPGVGRRKRIKKETTT